MERTDIWNFREDALARVDLKDFEVHTHDGAIGRVVQGAGGRDGGYLVVDPGSAMPLGRKLLVPAGLVERVDVDDRRISVRAGRDDLRNAPDYDAARPLDDRSRRLFGDYFASFAPAATTRRPRRSDGGTRTQPSSRGSRAQPRTNDEPTKAELYEQAKRLDIQGRSKLSKAELARAVDRAQASSGGRAAAKANPVEVQTFLEGVGYPTEKRKLVRGAKSQGANREVRQTLERLPEKRFESPTEVSEAIGNLG